jgi:hypothetical protein
VPWARSASARAASAFNVGFMAGAAVAGLALAAAGYRAFLAVCLATGAGALRPGRATLADANCDDGAAPDRASGAAVGVLGTALRDRRFLLVTSPTACWSYT